MLGKTKQNEFGIFIISDKDKFGRAFRLYNCSRVHCFWIYIFFSSSPIQENLSYDLSRHVISFFKNDGFTRSQKILHLLPENARLKDDIEVNQLLFIDFYLIRYNGISATQLATLQDCIFFDST